MSDAVTKLAMPSSSSLRRLQLSIGPPIARIALVNPRQNVIDISMMDEMAAVLDQIEALPDVSAVVFSGSGPHFSAGVDVKAHVPGLVDEMLRKFHAVIRKLIASRKVTIAMVRGNCMGGGAELAMVCDMAFTASDARWAFPEIRLGCFPPVAVAALGAVIGQKAAAELVLTGKEISGDEAAALGLANSAAPSVEISAIAEAAVARLAALSPAALALTKKALHLWDGNQFDKALTRAEDIYRSELIKTQDANEGIRAWMEKRPPKWEGK